MKRVLRLLSIFLFLFSLAQTEVYAQKKSRKMKQADNAFNLEQYVKAVELYKKAYKKEKNRAVKAEIIFKQAECYRMSGNFKRAESYYKRAIKAKYPNVITYLHYANILRIQEDYAEAQVQYNKYMQLNPTDVSGELGLKSCAFALKWKDLPTRYKVELMPLVNSRNSDYSPAFGNGEYTEMYFTSSRTGGLTDDIDDRTGETFSDVYLTKINKKGIWSVPVVVAEPINTKGNEGSVVLNKRGTVMYLTQCKVDKKKALGCGIYVSKRKGKLWGEPQLVQIKLDSNTTIGHPALSEDESILIFSSDMSGGYGGKDLWLTQKEKRNTWSNPINLGPMVNTPGDEMFPFLHTDGTIYFSSTGHIGMGGLDIYKTSQDENGAYTLPVNLKSPLNSSADDFSMIIEKDGERGYLTSNRDGGKGGDDIYQFELGRLVFLVKGVVTNSKTGGILTNAKVQLIGSDGSTDEGVTDNTGTYQFTLKPLTSYELVINTEGYLKKSVNETTVGIENNKVFLIDFSVDPIEEEIILWGEPVNTPGDETTPRDETAPGDETRITSAVAPRVEYDFAKSDLRPQSIANLNILVKKLKDNPNIVIELMSHTDYIGTNKDNKKLSQERADVCVAYLVSQGVDAGQLVAVGKGETAPFVIENRNGRFKVGDVLSERYISKIRMKKNKNTANQYNRRTSFKVLRQDYVPSSTEERK